MIEFLAGGSLVLLIIILLGLLGQILPLLNLVYTAASRLCRRFQLGRDSTYIQHQLNRVCDKLDYDAPGAVPHTPKIRWVNAQAMDQIRDKEVIICLAPGEPRARSLVKAALQYLATGFVPEARPYMPKALSEALDFSVARRIVQDEPEGQRVLMTDYIAQFTEANIDVAKWLGIFERLHAKNLFSLMFLPEIIRLGRRLYPAVPSESVRHEVEELTYLVNRLARRTIREEIVLDYIGAAVRVGVILFARNAVLDTYGEAAHWWRLMRKLRMDLDAIYLIAWTPRGLDAAQVIATRALREQLISNCAKKTFFATDVEGYPREHLIVACTPGVRIEHTPLSPEERLVDACVEVMPQILDQLMEIAAAGRIPGTLSIVAVQSLQEGFDAISLARAQVGRISEILGGEEVRVIQWSSEPADVIRAVLHIADYQGTEMIVDAQRQECLVGVISDSDAESIRGPDGAALRLAKKLTGWTVSVVDTN